ISLFFKRNLCVVSIIGRKIEAARAKEAILEQIRAFLKLFKRICVQLGIRTKDT
ncbi:hypothetical protein BU23DRAFT_478274, partial [Bimuria novae-zelandiae CBS 107.79]